MFSKKFLSGAALTALSIAASTGAAHAQSTASQVAEEEMIVVTGSRRDADGLLIEQAPKARTTITEEYITTQTAGQSILNTVNLVPGVNFTNNDAYGSSGGNIRMRGFDGNRISLTVDGVPLNDTGNYAIYSNQQLDPELISRASVNMGTTDVDSPTASATGGTINYTTRVPSDEFGLTVQPSIGSDNFFRGFAMLDTGAFGPTDATAFIAGSYTTYDQFVGPGDLEKIQLNGRLYQPLGGDDFISISGHYNRNRNAFYRQGSAAEWAANPNFSNIDTCVRDTIAGDNGDVAGRTNDNFGSSSNNNDPASCTNYYGLRINPSDTANIRAQSRFSLGENLTLTVDPTVQYTMANGGGTTVINETDNRLRAGVVGIANSDSVNDACAVFVGTTAGVDLNGDCDTLDSVRLYSPSNTNTLRYAVTASLIWDLNDSNRVIFGYTYDTGRHRQTGEYGLLDSSGDPLDVWGGKDEIGADPILTLAGDVFQKRNRLSVASLSQPSIRYIGDFLDDTVTVDLGVRAPFFTRELDQRCYVTAGSSSDPTCPSGTFVPSGVAPFEAEVEYEDVLPSVGLTFRPSDTQQVYFSYAEGLSAPRTDDLYNGLSAAQLDVVEPETTQSFDIGYRYSGENLYASVGAWHSQFQNRIVRVFDQDQGINISRNVGDVEMQGAELSLGYQVTDALSALFSTAYTESEVQDNLQTGVDADGPDNIAGNSDDNAPIFALTGGKTLVETPDWTATARFEYEIGNVLLGLQGRYVGERWATDVNDQVADSYTTFDIDARYNVNDNSWLQFNIINVTDEFYFGSISTQVATTGPGSGTVRYNIGAPRTFMMSLHTQF
ncbi:TonB-dependent receptor [Vitreimonas flagellata]|uniref:TonB-dependent receptor n=1 Tax=Vitreimonas flagellata TaxID=2560861 RepID=UPI0010757089|nr:TonB-dependent receptor [Vitreimonas flagellata]